MYIKWHIYLDFFQPWSDEKDIFCLEIYFCFQQFAKFRSFSYGIIGFFNYLKMDLYFWLQKRLT